LTLEKHQLVEEVPIPSPVLEEILESAEIAKDAKVLQPPVSR
jgi:hypothetical protein